MDEGKRPLFDLKEFDEACNIEDEFVLSELGEIKAGLDEQGDNFVSNYFREKIQKDKEDRKKYIGRYKKIREEHKKKNKHEIDYFDI